MKFFKFEDGDIKLDREEIALYKLPNTILRRDRGSEGDSDGRKKLQAFKEFTYVYFVSDHSAYPISNGLSEKETNEYAIQQAGLPSDFKPDDDLKIFIDQYKKEHWSQSKQIAYDLRRILRMNQTLSTKIQDNLDVMIEGTLGLDQITQFTNYQQKLIDIAVNLPKQIKALTEALQTIEQEENADIKIARGGSIVRESMNPDNDIESEDDEQD
jgi:hypothetical protein